MTTTRRVHGHGGARALPRVVASCLVIASLAACSSAPSRGRVDERAVPFRASAADRALVARLRTNGPASFEARTFDAPDGTVLPYRLKHPEPYVLASRYPLVVVLHGSDAIGTDNVAQLDAFAASWADPAIARRFSSWVVVPQLPTRGADYAPDAAGVAVARPGSSLPYVVALVDDLVARLPQVDRSRVYVVGFSMGASTALAAVVARPTLFAGAVALAGVPPDARFAASVARVPELLVHGTADAENAFAPARAWAEAVAAAGGTVRFVRYDGMDHRVPADLLVAEEWREWLFTRRSFE